jgi:coenzyme F420-0:L-glutamate ligase/coenzyme F420-1:gamma-L-glutamate ligase
MLRMKSESSRSIALIPVTDMPKITHGDNLESTICRALENGDVPLAKGDVLVVTHSIVSISEGALYEVSTIRPSDRARRIAKANNQDPTRVEIALREAEEVLIETPVLLTRTHHGMKTDYSGVDESNAPEGFAIALPRAPDASAKSISRAVSERFGFDVPVVISDTQGRPWRRGAVNLAIGVYGLAPILDNVGRRDIHGRALRSSPVCLADEIAAAAELVMGQSSEGIPAVIVRGLLYDTGEGQASFILRTGEEDLFDNQ